MKLKNVETLRTEINHIIASGANDIRLILMFETYLERDYFNSWERGDYIKNIHNAKQIQRIEICALVDDGDEYPVYVPISELKDRGYEKYKIDLSAENIALKFNIDVDTVKKLLEKI